MLGLFGICCGFCLFDVFFFGCDNGVGCVVGASVCSFPLYFTGDERTAPALPWQQAWYHRGRGAYLVYFLAHIRPVPTPYIWYQTTPFPAKIAHQCGGIVCN